MVPLSSQVRRLYPAEVFVSLGGEPRKAMADQVTTASKQPLRRHLGALSREDMDAVAKAPGIQFALWPDGNGAWPTPSPSASIYLTLGQRPPLWLRRAELGDL